MFSRLACIPCLPAARALSRGVLDPGRALKPDASRVPEAGLTFAPLLSLCPRRLTCRKPICLCPRFPLSSPGRGRPHRAEPGRGRGRSRRPLLGRGPVSPPEAGAAPPQGCPDRGAHPPPRSSEDLLPQALEGVVPSDVFEIFTKKSPFNSLLFLGTRAIIYLLSQIRAPLELQFLKGLCTGFDLVPSGCCSRVPQSNRAADK